MNVNHILVPCGLMILFGNFPLSVEGCADISNIKADFVQLGGNAILDCFVDSSDTRNHTLKWTRGQNDNLLTYDNSSIDSKKFKLTTNPLGFGLIIYNITKQDVNTTYTCSCGFAKKSITLQLKERKEPHNHATTVNDTSTYLIPVIFAAFVCLLQWE